MQVYKIASSSSYFSIKWIWSSQKGEELPKIDNFSVDAGKSSKFFRRKIKSLEYEKQHLV